MAWLARRDENDRRQGKAEDEAERIDACSILSASHSRCHHTPASELGGEPDRGAMGQQAQGQPMQQMLQHSETAPMAVVGRMCQPGTCSETVPI